MDNYHEYEEVLYIHGKVLEGQISSISMEKFYKHQQVS